MKSGSPSRTTAAHKTQTKIQAWSSLVFHCCHSSFYSFRSSSVGLETGERCRCRSLPITPPASLRSHGSRPRPTRHNSLPHVHIIHPRDMNYGTRLCFFPASMYLLETPCLNYMVSTCTIHTRECLLMFNHKNTQ